MRLYFVDERPERDAAEAPRPPGAFQLPEDVKLLDRCADAAAVHLKSDGYTAQEVRSSLCEVTCSLCT